MLKISREYEDTYEGFEIFILGLGHEPWIRPNLCSAGPWFSGCDKYLFFIIWSLSILMLVSTLHIICIPLSTLFVSYFWKKEKTILLFDKLKTRYIYE